MEQEYTYTQAIKRVEEIVSSLERGELDIDKMADAIKEAQQLLTFCTQRLDGVEAQTKQLFEDNGQG